MAKKKKNIVTIGGGTGQFMLLSGLKKHHANLTAVVSMADDGGSTGRLRDELGVSSPGDVRQCLTALSDAPEVMRDLMRYRFPSGELRGHSFGNLLLSALEKVTGGFSAGIAEAAKILMVSDTVLPVTEDDMRLKIILKNGKVLHGEKELDDNPLIPRFGIKKITLAKRVRANKDALRAIKKADAIVLGPSDLYGNVTPPLLVTAIAQAIKQSRAHVIFVCNIMNVKGQTNAFDLDDYVQHIERFIGRKRIDYAIYNTKAPARTGQHTRAAREHMLVPFDASVTRAYNVVRGNFLFTKKITKDPSDLIAQTRSTVRHDPVKLARAIMKIV